MLFVVYSGASDQFNRDMDHMLKLLQSEVESVRKELNKKPLPQRFLSSFGNV